MQLIEGVEAKIFYGLALNSYPLQSLVVRLLVNRKALLLTLRRLLRQVLRAVQLIEGAEAKAFYGLALNYKPLQALVERLLVKETLSGAEVRETLEGAGVIPFPDPYVEGFTWGEDGGLRYPGMPTQVHGTLYMKRCAGLLNFAARDFDKMTNSHDQNIVTSARQDLLCMPA